MRIIVVTANLPHGTDEAFIVPEIEELIRAGHEVLLVPRSPKGPVVHGQSLLKYTRKQALISGGVLATAFDVAVDSPRWILEAVKVIRHSRTAHIRIKNLAILPKAFWLAAIAREWKADHIHSHWAGTTATLAMIASGIAGIPWSFTAHRWDIVEDNLLRQKVHSARLARFISEDGLKMAQELGIDAQRNARVLKMGVALPASVERHSGRWPIVVCPARLVAVKGHQFLLEAWRILHDRGIHGELWLAGDGELRSRIEATIRRLGLQNVVRILGTLPHDELLQVYREQAISAVVLASMDLGNGNHEGIPVALIEAMGYAIPVVATSTGGTPELVKPGTGILVPPANASALADAIETLIRDQSLLQQVGLSARRHVFETHNLASVVSNFVNCIAEEPANHANGTPAAA